ncbi:MAG: DUF4180 domain-containing protein [Terracidiphilus sp.]
MMQNVTIHENPCGRILEYPVEGPPLGNVASCLETIGSAHSHGAELVAIPIARLDEEFFNLRNGIAGEVLQKFVTYRLRIAIVGDISPLSAASKALHDFVVECNRGSTVWFVHDLEELKGRLEQRTQNRLA